jgi:hypothetical protein
VRKQLPTIEDFARSTRTMLSKIKVNFFVGEAILGHQISGVAASYNRGDYAEEMPIAMAKLGGHISTIVGASVMSMAQAG